MAVVTEPLAPHRNAFVTRLVLVSIVAMKASVLPALVSVKPPKSATPEKKPTT